MNTIKDAQNNIHHLVDTLTPLISGNVTNSFVHKSLYNHLGSDAICIIVEYNDRHNNPCSLSVDISSKGELYNPIFMPNMLPTVFDWINRLGYDKTRIISRTELYKEDLMLKTAVCEF
jgi:hypothetical protein